MRSQAKLSTKPSEVAPRFSLITSTNCGAIEVPRPRNRRIPEGLKSADRAVRPYQTRSSPAMDLSKRRTQCSYGFSLEVMTRIPQNLTLGFPFPLLHLPAHHVSWWSGPSDDFDTVSTSPIERLNPIGVSAFSSDQYSPSAISIPPSNLNLISTV